MKIFVLHCSKLINRKHNILLQFQNHNITDFEFIELYDKDEITEEESSIFNTTNKPGVMSLHLKHKYVYKKIAENHDCALIFEDDVILSNNFLEILTKYMMQLPDDYDMLFIGDGCNLHIESHKIIPDKYVYEKCLYPTHWGGNGATRCTDSFVMSRKCAIKLCEYINNLTYKIEPAIDWWLNDAARDNNFKVYWAEPTIVTQGSPNGMFESTLQN